MLQNWLISIVRITSLVWFLYMVIDVNAHAIAALCVLLASVFIIRPSPTVVRIRTSVIDLTKNPFKRASSHRHDNDEIERTRHLMVDVYRRIADLVTYDAERASSLEAFNSTQIDTPCIFAKKARLWGSDDWKQQLSFEENINRWIPTFFKFTCLCSELALDGFLVQLPGCTFGESIENLSDGVRRLLVALAAADPAGTRCMSDADLIGRRGWVFQFNSVTFFVTSFAPCYPASSPRHCLPDSSSSFVLFQPEVSFAQHDLPPDSSSTDWVRPRNVRDRIRVAFRAAGRQYHIPDSVHAPMAHQVVRPLNELSDEVVEWWIDRRTVIDTATSDQ